MPGGTMAGELADEWKFVFGVDLDGVVADFYGGLRPIAAEWLGVDVATLPERVTWGLAEWGIAPGGYEALHRFAVTQRDLFRVIQPIRGAPRALRGLSDQKVRIRIITHRLMLEHIHQVTVRQTIEWLDRHGIPYWDLCFMKDKAAVGADLYIEDSPKNIEALRAENHPTIVFTNSTNETLPGPRADTWDEVVEIVLKQKQEWESKRKSHPHPRRAA